MTANTPRTVLPVNADGGSQMHTWVIGPHGVMRRQWWRQVGWHGQTGRVYTLTENPRNTEPGGWYPLWHLIENEAPPAPDGSDV